MNNIKEKDLLKIAKKIFIEPNKEVLKLLENDYEYIKESIKMLDKFDLSNVKPLTRISKPIDFLREDEEQNNIILDKKIALKNAANKNKDYIIIKRILK